MSLMQLLVEAVRSGDLRPSQVQHSSEHEVLSRAGSFVSRKDGMRIITDEVIHGIHLQRMASAASHERREVVSMLRSLRQESDRGIGDTLGRVGQQGSDARVAMIRRILTKQPEPMTLEQLNEWFPYQWRQPAFTAAPFVTSVSPLNRHAESQARAFDSWKLFGLHVIAVNTRAEIKRLSARYPQVDEWIANDREAVWVGRRTQKIISLLRVAVDKNQPVFIVNSDIEVAGSHDSLSNLIPDDRVALGIRWNYETDYADATEFAWGFDVIGVTPEHAGRVPRSFPYGIGQPVWDYAAPMVMSSRFKVLHERLFWHRKHPLNWNDAAWAEGAKWFSKRFGPIEHGNTPVYRQAFDPEMIYDEEEGRYVPRVTSGEVVP